VIVVIRKATTNDACAIAELHKKVVSKVNAKFYSTEIIEEWVSDITEDNVEYQFVNSAWIVAETGGRIIGFGQYSISDEQICQINVDPDYMNRNIGKRLYDYIENDFRSNDVKKIFLNSTLNAVGFYKKLGFKVIRKINFKLNKQSLEMSKMEKFLCQQG